MFEDIRESPVGRGMLDFAERGKLTMLKPERLFAPEDMLFPEPGMARFEDSHELGALKAAQLVTLSWAAYTTWLDLAEVFQLCESPIERHFLGALIVVAKDQLRDVVVHGKDRTYLETRPFYGASVHVYPQRAIGEYRVDFLLVLKAAAASEQDDGRTPGRPDRREFPLVVECDGHDFHEKTKEQASRDKQRDRVLQSCGYNVFRFSGADLHRQPLECASDCVTFLEEKVWGKDWRKGEGLE